VSIVHADVTIHMHDIANADLTLPSDDKAAHDKLLIKTVASHEGTVCLDS
jgi:hypothetical protein